jgi:pteridine reductase
MGEREPGQFSCVGHVANRPVALITGSGRRRLGSLIARGLAADGYRIAVHYHQSEAAARELVQELRELSDPANSGDPTAANALPVAEVFPADLRSRAAVQGLVASVVQVFGRLDALVNTASVWRPIPLEEITEQDLQEQFDVDLKGTFFCSQLAGLHMVSQSSGGAIVNFGDWGWERPYPNHSAYFAVKGAIPGLTRTMARELAQRNPKVRVNCILPGPVLLPPDADPEQRETLLASTLVRQVDRPDAIVNAVRYLVDNDFVTGVCLPVDGGRTIYAAHEDR